MQNITIKNAIVKILSTSTTALSPTEIYEKIIEQKLFEFKSKTPVSIVNSEIRKNCHGINLKKSNPNKIFYKSENGNFQIKK